MHQYFIELDNPSVLFVQFCRRNPWYQQKSGIERKLVDRTRLKYDENRCLGTQNKSGFNSGLIIILSCFNIEELNCNNE